MDGELTNGSARTGALGIEGVQGDCARDDSARAGAMSAPIVEVRNLVKRYGDVVALDHFDLRIEPGEIFGLLGPNGSGKTTAINCILQLLTFDKGDICLFGEPMTPTRYDLKRKNVALFEELTVRENIDFFCALYVDDRRERARLVDEAIAFVGLEDYVKFRPRKLSGGLLRRLNIACGIAHRPRLAFFDGGGGSAEPQRHSGGHPPHERAGLHRGVHEPLYGRGGGDLLAHHDHGSRPVGGRGHQCRAEGPSGGRRAHHCGGGGAW